MAIIGFRCSPACVRYAVIEISDGEVSLLNANGENRLVYPAGIEREGEKLVWLADEIKRIVHTESSFDEAVIKSNEYTRIDTKSKRFTNYSDAIIVLSCAEKNIPVAIKTYAQVGTKSADAQTFAEAKVGRTGKYWDKQMADAVVAAWSEGRKKV